MGFLYEAKMHFLLPQPIAIHFLTSMPVQLSSSINWECPVYWSTSAFPACWLLKALYNTCHIHQSTHTFMHRWLSIGSNLGFSILLKDTLTYRLEEPGIEPPTFKLVGDPLCLLKLRFRCRRIYSTHKGIVNPLVYQIFLGCEGCDWIWKIVI